MKKIECIVVICNHSYVDEVMDVAKAAGARGGTIIHGRGTDSKEAHKFFNITIQPEKALLLILASSEYKSTIMLEVSKQKGISTEAHAISFSLPVDDVVGLQLEDE